MPVLSNLEKLHTNLIKDGYDLPDLKTFEQDLGDVNKLGKLHTNLIKDGYDLPDIKTFQQDLGVKKKDESNSSLDISAGPYASGQPKGFGDIVSEKISEVTPAEQSQAKENDAIKKQAEKELSKKDTYTNAVVRGIKTAGTTAITGLKDLDTGLSILGKKVRDTFGIKDAELDEELDSKLDDNQVVSIVRDYQKGVDKQAQEIQKLREQVGSSSITENISKGNYAKALDYTGKTFVESLAPSLMFLNPVTATMSMGKTVGDEMQQAKLEGRTPTATDVTAGAIKGAAEYALTAFLGVGKVTRKAVSETIFKKEAKEALTRIVQSSLGKKVATTIGEEGVEEGLTQVVNNGVDIVLKGDKTKGWFDGVPDNVIVGMFGGGTQGTVANLILDKAEKQQAKQQQELPTNADLMSPDGMQQAGVEPGVPFIDLQNLDPDTIGSIRWDKRELDKQLDYSERRASATKPKNILDKTVTGIGRLLGDRDYHKEHTNKLEDTKRKLDLLENNPLAFYEEKIADYNKQLEASKDEEETKKIEGHIEHYEGVVEDLKDQEQAVPLSDDINSQFGESSDFISGLIDDLTERATRGRSDHIESLALLKYNPKKYLKSRINYYTKLEKEDGDTYWSETFIPKLQKALDDLEKNKVSFDDVMSYSQNQGDAPNADADNIDLTQLVKAKEVVQKIIDNDGVATSIDGTPVDIQELNEQGDVVLQDGNVVPMLDITVHSELGDNPLVDIVNAELDNEQQVPDSQPEQQQTPPTELPKKIFHATNAQFEGQPTRQEESKVSAYGTEPAGVFYSTDPDLAKQAIGDGENARIVEADFNPKNPLVIKNVDDEVYFNTSKESEQQAVNEFFDEYADSGVDLTEEAANENLPGEVKKRATEIFAEKLKEQGFDAVINQESGDIIVLDPSAVVDSYTVDEADMNNVDDSQAEIEYDNYYDNLELSERGKELQQKIDSIDDTLNNKDKPLSNTAKFRLKDMSTLLLKGDIYGLVNLALLNIKTPILLKDGVLNNGTKVKGIGVNKKDTWIATSTDANKSMSYDKLIDLVTEYVTDQVGQVSQTDEQGNASVAELVANADIPNMVYDIITGSKEDVYNTLREFTDQEVDVNALMAERIKLEEELHNEQVQYEEIVKKESNKIDLNEIQKNFELLFEVEGSSKKKNLTVDPKVMEIYNNFDSIIEQLGYKKTKDSDC